MPTKHKNRYKILSGRIIGDRMALYLNLPLCCGTYLVLSTILAAFAGYTYWINSNRPDDDPQKKKYFLSGVFIMPFFWPLLLVGWVSFGILKAIHFGFLLIVFTLTLVFIRKPFWLPWLEKIALKIGGMLLDANSVLVRMTFGESAAGV